MRKMLASSILRGSVLKGKTQEYAMQIRTSLKLDSEIKDRVQRLASARKRSAHWLMREAIEQYVEREEKRQQARDDAFAAWHQYQADGLHVTAEQADEWLARLEAGEDVDPPECHG